MRRAAISIAGNIAEGAARTGSKEFIQFLYISLGSASELDTQIEIARRIGLGEPSDLEKLELQTNMISRMLQGLIRSVKRKSPVKPLVPNHQSLITNRIQVLQHFLLKCRKVGQPCFAYLINYLIIYPGVFVN